MPAHGGGTSLKASQPWRTRESGLKALNCPSLTVPAVASRVNQAPRATQAVASPPQANGARRVVGVAAAQHASKKNRLGRRKTRGAALAARAALAAAAAVLGKAPRGDPIDAPARGRRLCSAGATHLRLTLRSDAEPTPLLLIVLRSYRPAPRSHAGDASREAHPRSHREVMAAATAAPTWLRWAHRPPVSDCSLTSMLWAAPCWLLLRPLSALRVGPKGRSASHLGVRSVARQLSLRRRHETMCFSLAQCSRDPGAL